MSEDLKAMAPKPARSEVTGEVYDPRTILLHWLTAVLVVVQWVGAHYIDAFPRGPLRVDARATHITIGVVLILLLLARLAWRNRRGVRLQPLGPAALQQLAKATHWGLYLLLAAVLAAGIANTWVRGDDIFGLFKIPSIAPGDRALRGQVEEIHEWLANALLIVAGLHALAGLAHEVLFRDRTLRRMLLSKRA